MPWSARTKTSRNARTSSGISRWFWRSAFPSTLSKISHRKHGAPRIARKTEEGVRPASHYLPDGALGEFSCLLLRTVLDEESEGFSWYRETGPRTGGEGWRSTAE